MIALLLVLSAFPSFAQIADDAARAKNEGNVHFFRAQFARAESAFRYVLARDLNDKESRISLALSLEAQEKHREAFAVWTALNAEAGSIDPFILYHLGRNHLMQGNFSLAQESWTKAVGFLTPPENDSEQALLRLITLMLAVTQHISKDYGGSNANLDYLAEQERVSLGAARYLEGMNCQHLKRAPCALEKLRLALSIDPTQQEARRFLADIQAGYGDIDSAYLDARRYLSAEKDPAYEKIFKAYAAHTLKPVDVLLADRETGFATAWPRLVKDALTERSPALRVGLFATANGEPQALSELSIIAGSSFSVTLAQEGDLAKGKTDESWRVLFLSTPTAMIALLKGNQEFRVANSVLFKTDDPARGSFLIKGARPWGLTESIRSDLQVRGHVLIVARQEGFFAINEIGLEEYLFGVLPYEIGGSSPEEALKAQAILARSYALWRRDQDRYHARKNHPFDACDQVHCQVYKGFLGETQSANEAVRATFGQVVKKDDVFFQIWYHASCGGLLRDGDRKDLRPGAHSLAPGLDAAQSMAQLNPQQLTQFLEFAPFQKTGAQWCFETAPRFSWVRFLSMEQLAQKARNAYPEIGYLKSVAIEERGFDGRVRRIRLSGNKSSRIIDEDFAIRQALAPGALRSAQFTMIPIRINKEQRYFLFIGRGYGHGRGACQVGMINQGKEKISAAQILNHYYPDAKIEHAY
ncbi:MAG: SpoIID/LytB domain-containing protein [Elusimicrobia bacterium]|nr:SpoIID/LytB domain-containing protein [Elusimicrobiota bacterium]